MAIDKGVLLGPYEILGRIGEGGMGEVWRARDRRIGRDVAVKVLPEDFAAGDQAVRRFEQEARAAGALNHPGLVTIFDVGTTGSAPYIVMELLEGQTMRDAIGDLNPVALPLPKAIDYSIQIASALAVAHEKGIIHRDLKPENLFITSDGRVKILDFGLAKLVEDSPTTEGSQGPARHLTTAGIAIGTPGYMSPEQVRALPLDHRTDIFSLGSVIYEIVSGRPAFECFSAVETMNAVLNAEPPPLDTLVPGIPMELDAIVRHCLEKNPRDRFQSTRDLAFQLRTLLGVSTRTTGVRTTLMPAAAPEARRPPYRAAVIAIVALLALAAGGWAVFHGRGGSELGPRTYKQLTFGDGLELLPTLAPDGKSFAYVSSQTGNRDIYVQRVDGRSAINITSESLVDDSEPAFSPDGDHIAFRSERDGGGIFVMEVTGESVRRLTDVGHNPSWSPDGNRIVVSTEAVDLRPHVHREGGNLVIIDTRTGTKRELVDMSKTTKAPYGGDSDALQPSWSPHGKRIAFWGMSDRTAQRDIFTIDPDAREPLKTVVRITADAALDWNPVWSPDGQFLCFGSNRDGTLNFWRVPMDEETGKTTGEPETLSLPGSISGNFAFSQQSDLAFTSIMRSYRVLAFPFDAKAGTVGPPRTVFGGSQEILQYDVSPDGQSIAFTLGGAQEDLFVANADGTRMRQLTNDVAKDRGPKWSPDGKMLYFYSNHDLTYHIWSIRADGSGLTRLTSDADLRKVQSSNFYSPALSPDGRTLLINGTGGQALLHLDRPPAQRVEAIENDLGLERWSPDGKRLVGATEKGTVVVYTVATRTSETVLNRPVDLPRFLPDGKSIMFFENEHIGILDLETRHETTVAFPPVPGVQLDFTSVLSRDATILNVRQTLEQGDIWLARFEKK